MECSAEVVLIDFHGEKRKPSDMKGVMSVQLSGEEVEGALE